MSAVQAPEQVAPPSDLLEAISHQGGGRVVLIIGAGSSYEPPTCIPLARECSQEACRKLVADRILEDGECSDPNDLCCLADTVKAKQGGQQRELVRRLPRERFRLAPPNEGHYIAAALLRERAVACVLTLNFDLVMQNALTQLDATDVSIVQGPSDHCELADPSLIYLHRNVNADDETWILTSAALEEEWQNGWEETIANRFTTSPITVFVGLGSRVSVLIESVRKVRGTLPGTVSVYHVDCVEREKSEFFAVLELPETAYVQMTWTVFMSLLGQRLATEQRSRLAESCNKLVADNQWDAGNIVRILGRAESLGIVSLGRLRARWLLTQSTYLPEHSDDCHLIADLLLTVELLERVSGYEAVLHEDGIVEFYEGNMIRGALILASGRGSLRWLSVEPRIRQQGQHWRARRVEPSIAIVGGVSGSNPDRATLPANIVFDAKDDEIIGADTRMRFYSVDDVRDDESLVREILK